MRACFSEEREQLAAMLSERLVSVDRLWARRYDHLARAALG